MIRQMILVAALVLCVSAFSGELKPASRPFLIWNQSDLDLIRVRQSETWMQDSMKRAANERNGGEFFQLFQAAFSFQAQVRIPRMRKIQAFFSL